MKTHQLMAFLVQYARMLSSKSGVSIRVSGDTACTDGKTVFVPQLLDVKDALLVKVLYMGYVVHEVCHVLWTDFDVYASSSAQKRPFLNILEDVAIEKKMGEWLPGCKNTLKELVVKLRETGRFGDPATATTLNAMLQAHCLYGLRSKVLGHSALADYAGFAAKALEANLPTGTLGRIDAVLDEVQFTQSTAERLALVDRLFEILEDVENQQQKQEPNSDSEKDPEPSNEDSDSQDDPSEDSDSGEQSKDEEGAGNSNAESGEGEQSPEQGSGKPQPGEIQGEEGMRDRLTGSPTDPDKGFESEMGDLAKSAMDGEILETADMYDADFDLAWVERRNLPQSPDAVHRVKQVTNGLVFRLRSLVESQTYCRRSLRDQGARISRKDVHRVVTGDMRVFSHEKRGAGVDTAVYLMLDTSGSMQGERLSIAKDTLLSMSLALQATPGCRVAAGRFPAYKLNDQDEYVFGIETFVEFGERVETRSGAIDHLQSGGGTPTAEALQHAAGELLSSKADRKICFVITDGDADNPNRLTRLINELNGEIEVIGIGIQTGFVAHTFKRHLVVNRLEDLQVECMKQLQQTLLAA